MRGQNPLKLYKYEPSYSLSSFVGVLYIVRPLRNTSYRIHRLPLSFELDSNKSDDADEPCVADVLVSLNGKGNSTGT
jgi:hypothetical protein